MNLTSKQKGAVIKIALVFMGFIAFTVFIFVSSPIGANLKLTTMGLVFGAVILVALWSFGFLSFLRATFTSLFQGDYMREFTPQEDSLFETTKTDIEEFCKTRGNGWVEIIRVLVIFGVPIIVLLSIHDFYRESYKANSVINEGAIWVSKGYSQIILLGWTLVMSWFLIQLSAVLYSYMTDKPDFYVRYKPNLNRYSPTAIDASALKRDLKHYIRSYKIRPDVQNPMERCFNLTLTRDLFLRIFYIAATVAAFALIENYNQKFYKALYKDHLIMTGEFFSPTEPQKISFSELDKVVLSCYERTRRRGRYSTRKRVTYPQSLRFYHDGESVLKVSPRRQYDVIATSLRRHRIPVKVGSTNEICRDRLKRTLKKMPEFDAYWKDMRK